MKCPACSTTLTAIMAGTIELEVCAGGCGGIWFDDLEVKKFDEPHENGLEAALAVDRDPDLVLDHDMPRPCPNCLGEVLFQRFYDVQNEVEVDQCLKCSGIWLDIGELPTIRGQYKTEAERLRAADEYLDSQLAGTMNALTEEQARDLAEIKLEGSSRTEGFKAGLKDIGADKPLDSFAEGIRSVFQALFR